MCYRIAQIILLALTLISGLIVFLPWDNLPILSNPVATRYLATKIIFLPIPIFFLLGSLWAGERARAHHH